MGSELTAPAVAGLAGKLDRVPELAGVQRMVTELPGGLTEWGHLIEATWNVRHRHFIYGRVERVDRDVYELTFKTQRPDTVAPDTTRVETLDLGYSIDVPLLKEAESAVGAAVAFYRFDSGLDDVYGSDPISFWAYLRFRFGSAGGHAHHH